MNQPIANELGLATSPYLQQHKDNPVDWKLWSEATLQKARAEDKPIFLSIGYSSCHWCHVMEQESFSNPEIAQILRENFVSIKVDREERPDLDHIYMSSLQMMTGQGGWPLNIFLTPDLRPFFGGTYFPPDARYGRPPFREVLLRLADVYKNQRDLVSKNAAQLTALLVQQGQFFESKEVLESPIVEKVLKNLNASVDMENGGLGGAPKFFHVDGLRLLLREAAEKRATEQSKESAEEILKKVEFSLMKMADGGVYDQIGGGFHRYSTDAEWKVPHFEKMLYDNALLAQLYAETFSQTQNSFYKRISAEILEWVLREMTNEDGSFYSAIDADSEHKEGEFYTWTLSELKTLIPAEMQDAFFSAYQIREEGNFEGRNILYLKPKSSGEREEIYQKFRPLLDSLLKVREKRVWPLIDRKVLTSWNGLMISGFVSYFAATGESKYLEAAKKAAETIWNRSYSSRDKRLKHCRFELRLSDDSFLEDYAFYTEALLDLFETQCEAVYLERAEILTNELLDIFYDAEGGGFWTTPANKKDLLTRTKEIHDGAIPSPYHVALSVLNRLYAATGNQRYKEALEKSFKAILKTAEDSPGGFHRFAIVYREMILGTRMGVCKVAPRERSA